MDKNEKIDLIYIMSPSYSGSTLLTTLLADNQKISTVGELKASALGNINEYYCSCGSKITDCGFWVELSKYINDLGHDFSFENVGTHFGSEGTFTDRWLRSIVRGKGVEGIRAWLLETFPSYKHSLHRILDQNEAVIDFITKEDGTNIFLDGSKDPNRLLHLMRSNRWNIKVIYLTRDGRGVCNSYMRHVGVEMKVAAQEWLSKCEEMDNAVRYFSDDKVLKLKYESLCGDVMGVLNDIYKFIGIDGSSDINRRSDGDKHLLGNNMRLVSISSIKIDEKWRDMLTKTDLEIFAEKCGDMQQKLGYSL
jgi:hypothetical protein